MTDKKNKPIISIIAAIGPNRELGKDNKLLWHISADLKRFKRLTQNHAVIMGRKTFESLGRPLPNRLNIVISRNKELDSLKRLSESDVKVCGSIEEALNLAGEPQLSDPSIKSGQPMDFHEVFVIGGGQIYAQAIALADKLYLTLVKKTPEHPDGKFEADTFFPKYNHAFTRTTFVEDHDDNEYKYSFVIFEKWLQ